MNDARFEDGETGPLALLAQDPSDLPVLSALLQDAVLTGADFAYRAKKRQLALLVSRFRWEDADEAQQKGRRFERVRSVLLVQDALSVRSQGIARGEAGVVHSLLGMTFTEEGEGAGLLTLTFAGDATIEVQIEAFDLSLRDVTRPHFALSGKMPQHIEDN